MDVRLIAAAIAFQLLQSYTLDRARGELRRESIGLTRLYRTQAALSLSRTDGGPQVIAALVRALGDSNPSVRAAAATALGAVGDAGSVAALQRVTANSQPAAVRSAATTAIASIQRRSAAPPSTSAVTATCTQDVP